MNKDIIVYLLIGAFNFSVGALIVTNNVNGILKRGDILTVNNENYECARLLVIGSGTKK